MATELAKPSTLIRKAISKYRLVPYRIPRARVISIPFMYMVSKASTRSAGVGPRTRRNAAQARPRVKQLSAKALDQSMTGFIRIPHSGGVCSRSEKDRGGEKGVRA